MREDLNFVKVQKELNKHSPSLCLAKWLQVTIHLQNGLTHSCHHPPTHKIPLKEIERNPSALHNTDFKKQQRKKMREGERPSECDYCWRIEDSSDENLSDRTFKSADDWAYPHLNEVISNPWDANITPSYVEVSFGNECNFKCSYCSPTISSGVLSEVHKFGSYKVQDHFSVDNLKKIGQFPYSKDELNPYVEAFWQWWPELSKKLEVFRITGGEPLLNPNTYKFLEKIIESPMPHLDLAINSNLSVPDLQFNKFLELSTTITNGNLVKKFEVYTSVDTYGAQAEYIRHGLNYDQLFVNIRKVLETLPTVDIVIMCTFNALSVPGFVHFLESVRELKIAYKKTDYSTRVKLNISYLRHPEYMAANILPLDFIYYTEKSLDYMLKNAFLKENTSIGNKGFQIFSEFELAQLRRILEWLKKDSTDLEAIKELRKSFYLFFTEYDERKGTSLLDTFPELADFILTIQSSMVF
jgi:organic radical activating enzyme